MEYKSKKEEKFDSIYQAHVNKIVKVAMHYTKDYDTAQEIAQIAFFKFYTHMDEVDSDYTLPWLLRITKNLLYNRSRDAKREILGEVMETILGAGLSHEYSETMEDHYMRSEQKRMAEELSDSIFERLYKKNEKWYEAIMLVYCLGKPQQMAAEELGIGIEILHSRLYRAKQWIRKNYEKEYEKVVSWF